MGDKQINASNETTKISEVTPLHNKWTFWAHLPHDADWGINSYKKIYTFGTCEEEVSIIETLPEKMIKNCMLFIMREGIFPTWEDKLNQEGGCFSYRISDKQVITTWKELSYALVGETLATDINVQTKINGITISPKKSFCVIKVWMRDCSIQNPMVISDIHALVSRGCLFKSHVPQL